MVDVTSQVVRTRRAAKFCRRGALLRCHHHLCAELPRPHDLQRPDRADQEGVSAQRHHDGPSRGLRLRAVLFPARHSHRARRRPAQPTQHRRGGLCVLRRGARWRCGAASSVSSLALAHRRRHRQIRGVTHFAVDRRRSLHQRRPRAGHLRHRHLSRRLPRLFRRRLRQPALWLADGVYVARPARILLRIDLCG